MTRRWRAKGRLVRHYSVPESTHADFILSLKDFEDGHKIEQTSMARIMAVLCQIALVSETQIRSRARQGGIRKVRLMFCYLARHHSRKSLPQIGAFICRDHSTVSSAIMTVTTERSRFEPMLSRVERALLSSGHAIQVIHSPQFSPYTDTAARRDVNPAILSPSAQYRSVVV